MSDQTLSNQVIQNILAEETLLQTGDILQVHSQEPVLFARALLPRLDEVRECDQMQAGVAIRACEHSIAVCPFLFRHACRNGAVLSFIAGVREIERTVFSSVWTEYELRRDIKRCSHAQVFENVISRVRATWTMNLGNDFQRQIERKLSGFGGRVRDEVMNRYQSGERNLFGMGNAITSVARDTQDHQTRWNLEKLGAAVLLDEPLPTTEPDRRSQSSPESRTGKRKARPNWWATKKQRCP